ncbi:MULTISPECIES: S-adenosyl-l-methionine hydroxide adenosyltransferase family protein [Anaerolinea]|uniref:SAM hydrolase/SAM-dependent halogenase family protein n=1 Tax=Anaerolinea TaxID=233189 RepID=UPI002613618B|nr:SAM-dependent chlorinase/fluorinase [Anaerolinea thermophila]
MKLITILTDFGLQDGYPGIMKGVIYRIAPEVKIVDITHLIPPQDIYRGARILERSYPYFPQGTIHIAVVDPGVGTRRRPVAAKIGEHYFVGPDNGLFTFPLLAVIEKGIPFECVELNQPQYWLENVSHVFHGRDIFAPVAAHLANGVPLSELGSYIENPVMLDLPQPQVLADQIVGEIIDIDHFGNLSTNIPGEWLLQYPPHQLTFSFKDITIKGLNKTFGERQPGEWVAFIDSDHYLAIAIVNGNAASRAQCNTRTPIKVILSS